MPHLLIRLLIKRKVLAAFCFYHAAEEDEVLSLKVACAIPLDANAFAIGID